MQIDPEFLLVDFSGSETALIDLHWVNLCFCGMKILQTFILFADKS